MPCKTSKAINAKPELLLSLISQEMGHSILQYMKSVNRWAVVNTLYSLFLGSPPQVSPIFRIFKYHPLLLLIFEIPNFSLPFSLFIWTGPRGQPIQLNIF